MTVVRKKQADQAHTQTPTHPTRTKLTTFSANDTDPQTAKDTPTHAHTNTTPQPAAAVYARHDQANSLITAAMHWDPGSSEALTVQLNHYLGTAVLGFS